MELQVWDGVEVRLSDAPLRPTELALLNAGKEGKQVLVDPLRNFAEDAGKRFCHVESIPMSWSLLKQKLVAMMDGQVGFGK